MTAQTIALAAGIGPWQPLAIVALFLLLLAAGVVALVAFLVRAEHPHSTGEHHGT